MQPHQNILNKSDSVTFFVAAKDLNPVALLSVALLKDDTLLLFFSRSEEEEKYIGALG